MEDYPRDVAEFERWFTTEDARRAYLARLRWPEGFRCPRCGHGKAWAVRSVWFQCAACAHQTSVTAGTILPDTRTPLATWFRAMWWVTNQKTGVSALGLQRALGVRSYKTAWTWLHKLRRAMVRPGRDRLTGRVEVDETYVGSVHPGRRGRQTETLKDNVTSVRSFERAGYRIRRESQIFGRPCYVLEYRKATSSPAA